MAKAYVDSNVFISLIHDEFGKNLEFMAYRSEELFDRVLSCLHTIVVSKQVLMEISKITLLTEEELKKYFSRYRDKIKIVRPTLKDFKLAEEFNKKHKIGKMDSLYILSAIKEGCDCIVTWNKKHFVVASDRIKILDPGEL